MWPLDPFLSLLPFSAIIVKLIICYNSTEIETAASDRQTNLVYSQKNVFIPQPVG